MAVRCVWKLRFASKFNILTPVNIRITRIMMTYSVHQSVLYNGILCYVCSCFHDFHQKLPSYISCHYINSTKDQKCTSLKLSPISLLNYAVSLLSRVRATVQRNLCKSRLGIRTPTFPIPEVRLFTSAEQLK